MLPKWFNDWNRDKPADIYGPAILVGVAGTAVIVAAALISLGQPMPTKSMQTGPAGTGMAQVEFVNEITDVDPTLADYYTEAPYEVTGDEPLARDVYENVQVLGGLTEDNFNRVMLAMTQWVAPEQGCAYCHGNGGLETYGEDNVYTKIVSRRMIQMTQNINENWGGHVNAQQEVGVNCYTCHRGLNVPSDIWFRITPLGDTMEGWGAVQNRVSMQSQYTSLPSDALETYLLEDQPIGVHDYESHVDSDVSDPNTATWQDAERTYSLMNYVSNSLGVNCTFCHNSRAFNDGGQVTPQWATDSLGILMVKEMNLDYLVPLRDEYPENRLGPVHGDAPKAACRTCHKGYQQPLQGRNVIADWPELATTGDPVYE